MATLKTQAVDSKMLVRSLLRWFRANARDLPWRRTRDAYAIWVSEVMLQQTQVKTVLPYWKRWMQRLPHIASLARAAPDEIHKLWEGLGYYHRVRNMQRAARKIVEKHRGKFPRDFVSILALPGIGRYTAGAISSIAFNQPQPVLDGNVIRVLTRLYGIALDPAEAAVREQLWNLAEELVQASARLRESTRPAPRSAGAGRFACSDLNQSLMELGALVCRPRDPGCVACPVSAHCIARRTKRVLNLPFRPRRAPTTAKHFTVFLLERSGRILVRKRAEGTLNGGLWELPGAEITHGMIARDSLGVIPVGSRPLCRIRHSITRYRVTTEAFRAMALRSLKTSPTDRWVKWKDLHRLAFPSAHKQIIEILLAAAREEEKEPGSRRANSPREAQRASAWVKAAADQH
jgi:A/G-specific adenine glycosylase